MMSLKLTIKVVAFFLGHPVYIYIYIARNERYIYIYIHLHKPFKKSGIRCSLCSVSLISVKILIEGTYDMPYKNLFFFGDY